MLNEVVLDLPREARTEGAGPSKRGAAIRDMNDGGCPPKMLGTCAFAADVPGVPGLPGVDGRLDSMPPVSLFVCSPEVIGRQSRTLDIVVASAELFQVLKRDDVAARGTAGRRLGRGVNPESSHDQQGRYTELEIRKND